MFAPFPDVFNPENETGFHHVTFCYIRMVRNYGYQQQFPPVSTVHMHRNMCQSTTSMLLMCYADIYLYNTNSVSVNVFVSCRQPNGWTDHDQIWHACVDRPENGHDSQTTKNWPHVWAGKGVITGPISEVDTYMSHQAE